MAARRRRRRGRPQSNGQASPPETRNGTVPERAPVPELCELGPLSVFCALHLGITEDDGWSPPDPGAVARRFDLTPGELERYLEEHRLSAEQIEHAGFDLEAARLDIRVAPEGVSRLELARTLFTDLQNAT